MLPATNFASLQSGGWTVLQLDRLKWFERIPRWHSWAVFWYISGIIENTRRSTHYKPYVLCLNVEECCTRNLSWLSTSSGCPPVTSKPLFEIDNVIYSSMIPHFMQGSNMNIDSPLNWLHVVDFSWNVWGIIAVYQYSVMIDRVTLQCWFVLLSHSVCRILWMPPFFFLYLVLFFGFENI